MNILTKDTKDKGNTPKDIMLIKQIIESEGIVQYEKNSLNFISEFLNRYITETLEDSVFYAKYAGRTKPNFEDVKLAVKLKKENNFSKIPDLEQMKQNSFFINSKSLQPLPMGSCQLTLPSIESTLLKNNYHIYSEQLQSNIEKNNNKANNWFHSNKIENYIRVKHKGLSLAKKRIHPISANNNIVNTISDYNKSSNNNNINSNKIIINTYNEGSSYNESKRNKNKNNNNNSNIHLNDNNDLNLKERDYADNKDDEEENYD